MDSHASSNTRTIDDSHAMHGHDVMSHIRQTRPSQWTPTRARTRAPLTIHTPRTNIMWFILAARPAPTGAPLLQRRRTTPPPNLDLPLLECCSCHRLHRHGRALRPCDMTPPPLHAPSPCNATVFFLATHAIFFGRRHASYSTPP
jgi:hypothetical protein